MSKKTLRKINSLLGSMGKELRTVAELEQRAKELMEANQDSQHHFFKGFLRAIAMLRERELLRE